MEHQKGSKTMAGEKYTTKLFEFIGNDRLERASVVVEEYLNSDYKVIGFSDDGTTTVVLLSFKRYA